MFMRDIDKLIRLNDWIQAMQGHIGHSPLDFKRILSRKVAWLGLILKKTSLPVDGPGMTIRSKVGISDSTGQGEKEGVPDRNCHSDAVQQPLSDWKQLSLLIHLKAGWELADKVKVQLNVAVSTSLSQ